MEVPGQGALRGNCGHEVNLRGTALDIFATTSRWSPDRERVWSLTNSNGLAGFYDPDAASLSGGGHLAGVSDFPPA